MEKGEAYNITAVEVVADEESVPSAQNTTATPSSLPNPREWRAHRKWTTLLLVSALTLLSPLSATMIAPAAPVIAVDLDVTSASAVELTLSVFLLGLGIGPLVMSPLSERYGRYPVLLCGNSIYLAANTGAGFAQSQSALAALRFLSGIGAGAPLAIGGGIIADLWEPQHRGTALAVYSTGPLLGPALGPIAGGFITWRWIFWCFSIVDAVFLALAAMCVRETYAPRLQQKAGGTRQQTHTTVLVSLTRPLAMLARSWLVQVLALYVAILYGMMFLLLFNYPMLWTATYRQTPDTASLNYLSLGLGYVVGAQAGGRLNDAWYRRKMRLDNHHGVPEFRVVLMIPATILVIVGILLFAWSGQYAVHWIVPNIGGCLFSTGFIACFQLAQSYTIDAFQPFAASALATQNLAKSVTGFSFPLFAPQMYAALGFGYGNSVLTLVVAIVAAPTVAVLGRFGVRLRTADPFAAAPNG